MHDDKVLIISSVGSEQIAINCAQAVLEDKVAACVNIVPKIHSIYRWNGEIVDDHESILLIKTVRDQFEAVRDILEEHSGYEVTEVLCIEIADGSKAYLDWVEELAGSRSSSD